MLKKRVKKETFAGAVCIVIFFGALFFYWRTFTNTALSPETPLSNSKGPPVLDVSTTPSNPYKAETPQRPRTELERTPKPEETLDTQELQTAIDFLEKLERNLGPESGIPVVEELESNGDLSEDEMLQLIREGVAYYDSLLESGSVNFFMQASSVDYPGRVRMSTGTWEGTFDFSDNRFATTVRKNVTDYDETFGPVPFHGTEQFAYDGETFESLEETRSGKRLTRRSEVVDDPFLDPRAWGWGITDRKENLTPAINRLENPRIQQVDWNGTEVYHVKGTIYGALHVELWLNPEKSYRPERHISFITNGESLSSQTVSDYAYQEVAPDLWFPKSGREVTTITDLKTGIETDVQTRTIQFSNHRINESIPANRFTIDVSPGMTVFDVRTRESFKVE